MGQVPDVPVVMSRCPPLVNYSADKLAKAANELRDVLKRDPQAATPDIVRDYRILRDMCRAYSAPSQTK